MTDPTVALEYGESFRNVGLEIAVETPSIETSFRIEPDDPANDLTPTPADRPATTDTSTPSESITATKRVELTTGRAVVLAPVTFSNRHESRDLRITAPQFVLVGDELEVVESRHLSHPDIEQVITPDDLERFSDLFSRWNMHGTEIESSETVEDVALFEVPNDVTIDEFDIVFDPYLNGFHNDYFEPRAVAWRL